MQVAVKRTQIRLDGQAREDAQRVMQEYGLGSVSAAVRFSLREIAKRSEKQNITPKITRPQRKGSAEPDEEPQ